MANGDVVAVQSGILSGAAISAYLNTLNLGAANASGGTIFFLNMGNGQAIVYKISVTGY